MHVHFLDPYHDGRSLIHHLDARVKLVLAIAYILAMSLTPAGAWPVYLMLAAILLAVEVLSEERIAFYLKRSLLALPFVLAALPVIFTLPGPALVGFSIGSWQLQVSLPGVERFISILIKSWASVQMAVVLTTTTPFPDLLMAMRALRLPRLLVGVIGLMWRYMFVLVDEAMRLNRARASRSGEADSAAGKTGGNFAWRARVTGGMVGNLFMRSFDRSDRIYVSMLSRGYDGEVRSLPQPAAPRWTWTVLAVGLLVLGLITVIALLGWT